MLRNSFICEAALLLLLVGGQAYADDLRERVVSDFVFKIIKFTEWPNLPEEEALNLCTVARPEMFSLFRKFAGRKVFGHPLRVVNFKTSLVDQCQVLFIARGLIPACDCRCLKKSSQILIISDNPGFTSRCGIIGLYEENHHLRFEVNVKNAELSGIRFGAQMLRMARILTENEQ